LIFISLNDSPLKSQWPKKYKKNTSIRRAVTLRLVTKTYYSPTVFIKIANKMPAATAEQMTPATFGQIACINKKLPPSSLGPTICATRAESGTAETPAAPMI